MTIVTVIICLISLVLIGVVLLQKSKGGGLAAGFQSSNQIMGAPKTADFLEKATWSLMAIIAALCIVCTISIKFGGSAVNDNAIEMRENISLPSMPEGVSESAETPAPAETPEN